jgi:threonine dehydrogenase-like Zn-dependent dehydrogenase
MKALRFDGNQLRLTENAPVPGIEGEALVRVILAGICNTDLEIVRGYAGFSGTIGHEFVGIVVSSPDRSQEGCRVVGEINAGCGVCALCRDGDPRHCSERSVLGIYRRDGAFAEFLSLPARNLLFVPDGISDRQAVFTEPLAAACEILDQVRIEPAHRVVVIGDGKLGQLIARVLATTGCELTMIGKHPEKLALAQGIRCMEVRGIDAATPARFDIVVEASGSPDGLRLALGLVRPRGFVVLKSTFHAVASLDTSRVVVDEITLIGSCCGRFAPALDLLATVNMHVEQLISAEYGLSEGIAAMKQARETSSLKILLRPEQHG